jgi:hypothetical protein
MKNILKHIIALSMVVGAITSCRDDDKSPYPELSRGVIPLFTKNDDDSGFVNLIDPSDTKISFSLDKEGDGQVSSIDILLTYNNSVTDTSYTVNYSTVSSFPAQVVITQDELIGAFAPEIVTADTLDPGDSFVINGAVKMSDGRYLNGGYSPSVFSKRPVLLTYNVACPSEIGGTFDYVTTNIAATGPGSDPAACGGSASGTVKFEDQGGGIYKISDITFGQYGCAWGDTPAVGVSLNDVCNHLTLTGTDQYGLIYSISIVSNNGTDLVIDWNNDYGDSGRTKLTRTDGTEWPLDLQTD